MGDGSRARVLCSCFSWMEAFSPGGRMEACDSGNQWNWWPLWSSEKIEYSRNSENWKSYSDPPRGYTGNTQIIPLWGYTGNIHSAPPGGYTDNKELLDKRRFFNRTAWSWPISSKKSAFVSCHPSWCRLYNGTLKSLMFLWVTPVILTGSKSKLDLGKIIPFVTGILFIKDQEPNCLCFCRKSNRT